MNITVLQAKEIIQGIVRQEMVLFVKEYKEHGLNLAEAKLKLRLELQETGQWLFTPTSKG